MQRLKIFALLLIIMFTGCAVGVAFVAGGAAGIGGYKYYKGKMVVIYKAPFKKTWNATLRAFDKMNFQIVEKRHDLTKGKVVGKRIDKTPVTVTLKYLSSSETEVQIRVGTFGDKSASEAIKEEIRKQIVEG